MNAIGTFEEAWERFATTVVADDRPDGSIVEMRRAFYAGGVEALGLVAGACRCGESDTVRRLAYELEVVSHGIRTGAG